MSGKRILSGPQLDEMAELRERGWSTARIAKHFTAAGTPISASCVSWQCLRVGADLPRPRQMPSSQRTEPYVRGGFVIRPFMPADDELLLRLESEGATHDEMARQLWRKNNSIRGRLMTLARRDARSEGELV